MYELTTLKQDFIDDLLTTVAHQVYYDFVRNALLAQTSFPLLVTNYGEDEVEQNLWGFYPHSDDHTFEMQVLYLDAFLEGHPQAQALLEPFYGAVKRMTQTNHEQMLPYERNRYYAIPTLSELASEMSVFALVIGMKDALTLQENPTSEQELADWDTCQDERIIDHWLNRYFDLINAMHAHDLFRTLSEQIRERMEKLHYTALFTTVFVEEMELDIDIYDHSGFIPYDDTSAVRYAEYLDYLNKIRGGGFSCTN